MGKQKKKQENTEELPLSDESRETPSDDAGAEATVDTEAPAAGTEQTLESLQEALDEATAQAAENWDKFVRAQAELDNIAKRNRRELENAHKYAIEKFVSEMLPIWDSLEMGLDHADGDDIDAQKLKEGHELTLRMLSRLMEKFNVVCIDPQGEAFNPDQHEAMTMQPSDDVAADHVLTVIQKGYALNDRLIRPARVVVAKAPD